MKAPSNRETGTRPDRPDLPQSYGIKPASEGRILAWEDVADRLASSRNYWISTTSPRGIPHSAPVWGLWLQDTFVFGTDPASRKGRNLAANSSVVLHLESGDDVVIVEGDAVRLAEAQITSELDERYLEKYGYRLSGNSTYRIQPRKVLAWSEADFPESATRWRFPG